MLRVKEYWSKVVRDPSAQFGSRVLPEYEVKATWTVDNTLEDLRKRWKNNPKMTFGDGHITEDTGTHYGIHSYIQITEE